MEIKKIILIALFIASLGMLISCGASNPIEAIGEKWKASTPADVDVTSDFVTKVSGEYENENQSLSINSDLKTIKLFFSADYFKFEGLEWPSKNCKSSNDSCYCDENGCEGLVPVKGKCELRVSGTITKVQREGKSYDLKGGHIINMYWKVNKAEMKYLDKKVEFAQAKSDLDGGTIDEQAKKNCEGTLKSYSVGNHVDWIRYDDKTFETPQRISKVFKKDRTG